MAKHLLFLCSLLVFYVAADASILDKIRSLKDSCSRNKNAKTAAPSASPNGYTSLTSKFTLMGAPNVDGFFTIPRTVKDVEALGWKQPPETAQDTRLKTYCEGNDFRICPLYDQKGSIAGYQISLPTSVDLQDIRGIDYTTKGFTKQTLFGKEVYSTKIYFVEQSVIDNGGRDWDNSTGTGIWVQAGPNLVEIPINADEVEEKTAFKKQNCFLRMGHHFFWNLTRDLETDGYQPWFVLYNNEGILHGLGLIAFGSKSDYYIGDSRRSWFEDVTTVAIKAIAPSTPDWIFDTMKDAGVYAHHIYLQEEPWKFTCPLNSPKVNHY